jgi:hypothetical protein
MTAIRSDHVGEVPGHACITAASPCGILPISVGAAATLATESKPGCQLAVPDRKAATTFANAQVPKPRKPLLNRERSEYGINWMPFVNAASTAFCVSASKRCGLDVLNIAAIALAFPRCRRPFPDSRCSFKSNKGHKPLTCQIQEYMTGMGPLWYLVLE